MSACENLLRIIQREKSLASSFLFAPIDGPMKIAGGELHDGFNKPLSEQSAKLCAIDKTGLSASSLPSMDATLSKISRPRASLLRLESRLCVSIIFGFVAHESREEEEEVVYLVYVEVVLRTDR